MAIRTIEEIKLEFSPGEYPSSTDYADLIDTLASTGGSTSFTVSDTAPGEPSNGDGWFDSTDGSFLIYYDDGDTSQWVQVSGKTGPQGEQGIQGPAGPTGDIDVLTNVDTTGVLDGNALVYDEASSTWIPGEGGGGASFTVSETAPAEAESGDVWFNSAIGKTYIYYVDGDSSQWIEIGNPGGYATIANLADVDVASVQDGNALIYDAATGTWIPGEGGGGASFTIAETAPEASEAGDVWFNSTTGKTYIYYTDADTSQWVEIASTTIGYLDLNQLNDVNTASISDGQALVYDSATSTWVNGTIDVPSPTDPIKLNENVIAANYTIPTGYNGLTAGPVTIADGVTVTIADGSAWSIV